MPTENMRKEILNDIFELYHDSNIYDKLLELIENNENIADLLKSDAVVYYLLMANPVWNNNMANTEYGDSLVKYQKGYQLYINYAYYFLGANIIYLSLAYQINDNLRCLSLLNNDKIDYSSYLSEITCNKR